MTKNEKKIIFEELLTNYTETKSWQEYKATAKTPAEEEKREGLRKKYMNRMQGLGDTIKKLGLFDELIAYAAERGIR